MRRIFPAAGTERGCDSIIALCKESGNVIIDSNEREREREREREGVTGIARREQIKQRY